MFYLCHRKTILFASKRLFSFAEAFLFSPEKRKAGEFEIKKIL